MAAPALASHFGLTMLGTYHDRAGEDHDHAPAASIGMDGCGLLERNLRCPSAADQNAFFAHAATGKGGRKTAVWSRIFGATGQAGSSGGVYSQLGRFGKQGPPYDYGVGGFQLGIDLYRKINANGSRDAAGVHAGLGRVESQFDRVYGGKADVSNLDGYSLGGYWTHKTAGGWYLDAVLQGTHYQSKAHSVLGAHLNVKGWGLTASLETGLPIALGQGWTIEPQAQLIYQHIALDGGMDRFGRIDYDASNAVHGRVGARLTKI